MANLHTLNDRNPMKSLSKVMLVVAGYLVALVIASVGVGMYIAATNEPDRQTYGGMFAFGDSILFLGIFAVAAMPASGAALFFLRPYHTLWRIASLGALAIATTGIAALAANLLPFSAHMDSLLGVWAEVAPLRIFLAPPLALACLLAGVFAPTRASRIALLCASGIETIVFVLVALIWFHPFL